MKKAFYHLIKTKRIPLVSKGSSMLPLLRSGDTIYYQKAPYKKYSLNDIVVIRKRGRLISHRVIFKAQKYLITKGDNGPISDGKVYPKQIVGKVIKVKRRGSEFDPNLIYLAQSSLYLQEIIKIKQILEKAHIDLIFLKGLPLHLFFEGAHPRRIYADCDVLIDKNNRVEVEKILISNGYKKYDNHWSETVKKLQEREVEVAFVKTINGFPVVFDLHFQIDLLIVHLGKLDMLYSQQLIDQLTAEYLNTKEKIEVRGESFFILNPTFLILYLALHLFHHNYDGAFRYDFLNTTMIRYSRKHRDNVFKDITACTREYHLQNFIYPVFVLLKKHYKTPIPSSFIRGIQPTDFISRRFIAQIIKKNIFNDESRIRAGINRFKYLLVLSQNPLWVKMLVFINPQVVYTIAWVIFNKLKQRFFSFSGRR